MVEIIAKWKGIQSEFVEKHGRQPEAAEVAAELNLSDKEMAILKRAIHVSDHVPCRASLEVMWPSGEVVDPREDSRPDRKIFTRLDIERLDHILRSINERDAAVLRLRYGLYDGEPLTLAAVGKHLRLTRERIRQIEKKALRKLQKRMSQR